MNTHSEFRINPMILCIENIYKFLLFVIYIYMVYLIFNKSILKIMLVSVCIHTP